MTRVCGGKLFSFSRRVSKLSNDIYYNVCLTKNRHHLHSLIPGSFCIRHEIHSLFGVVLFTEFGRQIIDVYGFFPKIYTACFGNRDNGGQFLIRGLHGFCLGYIHLDTVLHHVRSDHKDNQQDKKHVYEGRDVNLGQLEARTAYPYLANSDCQVKVPLTKNLSIFFRANQV